jgi:hypothetical protein
MPESSRERCSAGDDAIVLVVARVIALPVRCGGLRLCGALVLRDEASKLARVVEAHVRRKGP